MARVTTIDDAMLGSRLVSASRREPDGVWPSRVKHLSASSVGMFKRCPEQWRRRYLQGEKRPPGVAAVWGTADHAAHAHNFTQKMTTHADLPLGDVEDAFSTAWDAEVDRWGGELEWGDKPASAAKDSAALLVAAYHRYVSPGVQPIMVEEKFERSLVAVPVPVIGYIDLETQSSLIERKTTQRRETKPKSDWRVQAMLYAAAKRKPVEFHVATKTAKPMVYTPASDPGLTVACSPRDAVIIDAYVTSAARMIGVLYAAYGPDEPWPDAITHPWACGYCGYRPSCSWWSS